MQSIALSSSIEPWALSDWGTLASFSDWTGGGDYKADSGGPSPQPTTPQMHDQHSQHEDLDGGLISRRIARFNGLPHSMDPITLITSLLAIGGAVCQISKAVNSAHRGLKNASKEVAEAANQIAVLRLQLEQLKRFTSSFDNGKQCDERRDCDAGLVKIVAACQALMVDIEAAFPPQHPKRSPIRRQIQWVMRDREQVTNLLGRLDFVWGLLNTSLQLKRTDVDRAIQPTLAMMMAQQNDMHSNIRLLTQELKQRTGPGDDIDCVPSHGQPHLPSPGIQFYKGQKSSKASMDKWLLTPQLVLVYCRTTGQQRRRTLFLGAVLPGAKVFLVRWSSFSSALSMSFSVKVRSIIPVESEYIQACKNGNVVKVKELLDLRQAKPNDITDSNETPLMFAIDSGSLELVEALLFSGADSNMVFGRWQTSPLQVAFETGQPDMARALIRQGADIDYLSARGWPVISYLWENGKAHCNTFEFYELCSAQSFDAFDAQDRQGWSLLHRAAAYGTEKDIDHLLLMGASMSLCTRGKAWTPIHVASALNNKSTLHAFAKRVSFGSFHSPDVNGWTPLHIAIERGAEDTMRYLLRHGAYPHARNYITASWFPMGLEHRALTPEDLAYDRSSEFVIKYQEALVEAHFDVCIIDDDIFWNAEEFNSGDTSAEDATPCFDPSFQDESDAETLS